MPDYMLKFLEEGSGVGTTAAATPAANTEEGHCGSPSSSVDERHSVAQDGSSNRSAQTSPKVYDGQPSASPSQERHSSPCPSNLISKAFGLCVDRMSLYNNYCQSGSDSSTPNSPATARKGCRSPRRQNSVEKRLWDRVKVCEHNYAKEWCSDADINQPSSQVSGRTELLSSSEETPPGVTLPAPETTEAAPPPESPSSNHATCDQSDDEDGGDILCCQKCHIAVHASESYLISSTFPRSTLALTFTFTTSTHGWIWISVT